MPGADLPDAGRRPTCGNLSTVGATSSFDLAAPDTADLDRLLAYWEAANFLTVGQIYLRANPLLREPLRPEHIKPRLLGHWGTSPGLNLIYAQLNRMIGATGDDVLFVVGPGHGGPAVVANVYLEGTYSEVYPEVSADEAGLLRLVRQFSTPGGIPSHVSVPTPGSIHEGGELGYALVHAFGAAFDHPDLLVACVIGDGEAETAPLEGSWKGVRFLNPARDGAVLPILHLNGYKISGPTVLGRASEEDDRGAARRPRVRGRTSSTGTIPREVHRDFAVTLDRVPGEDRGDPGGGPHGLGPGRAAALAGDRPADAEGLDRPGAGRRRAGGGHLPRPPGPARRGAREPRAPGDAGGVDALLPARGALRRARPPPRPELAELAPAGEQRMGATSYANGGRRLVPLELPDSGAIRDPGRDARQRAARNRRAASASCCATSTPPTPTPPTSGSSVPTRPTPTGSAPSSRSRTAA